DGGNVRSVAVALSSLMQAGRYCRRPDLVSSMALRLAWNQPRCCFSLAYMSVAYIPLVRLHTSYGDARYPSILSVPLECRTTETGLCACVWLYTGVGAVLQRVLFLVKAWRSEKQR
ncbi:unnamed protein product, partial [Ectocarpus fasciculatus]